MPITILFINSLIDKNYEVIAATRGIGERDLQNLILLKVNLNRLKFEFFDLSDPSSIQKLIIKYKPSHFFNFAGQSYVGSSWDVAQRTLNNNTSAVLTMLETIKLFSKHTKFYQASSSEMFGNSNKKYINETFAVVNDIIIFYKNGPTLDIFHLH